MLRPREDATTYLAPVPVSAAEGRGFAARTLRAWGLQRLAGPVSVVVSELVTDSLLHACTVQALSLSRCEDRVRIAVRDHSPGPPFALAGRSADGGEARAPGLVRNLSLRWGYFPAASSGKTVWAVLAA